MMKNLTILDTIVLPAMESKKEKNKRTEALMRKLDIIEMAAKCSRVLYIVDGNIKGQFQRPSKAGMQEKDSRQKKAFIVGKYPDKSDILTASSRR